MTKNIFNPDFYLSLHKIPYGVFTWGEYLRESEWMSLS